jgi:subtilisin family serine protease
MKKYLVLFLVCIGVILKISALENLDNYKYYPNNLIVCFSSELIGNTEGQFEIEKENEIIKTPFVWFNELSRDFKIIELNQLYKVKDKKWNKDNKYPMNVFRIVIKDSENLDNLFNSLIKVEDLLFVEYDPIHKQSYIPDDPQLLSQWAIKKIEADKAWDFETGSSEVIIGICDSGVKWNHIDLADNIYVNEAEMPGISINWETGEITGGDGIDNDDNGFIDDVLGWDFAEGNYENWSQDNNPFQKHTGNGHGTHVAGCVAAVGDNGIGVVGPAYNTKILATKHSFTNQSTNYIFDGYSGIYYLVDTGADIINCSWGGAGGGENANLAVSYAKEHNSLVVAAASNDNTDNTYNSYYPSDAIDGVSVAATNPDDTKASFSNYGLPIDVSSPGVNILSTYYGQFGEDSFSSLQGTSMASPVAAGVLGLIRSMYPDISIDDLVLRLKTGCEPIDHLNSSYLQGKLGAGRINAFNSLMYDRIPYVTFQSYYITELTGEDNTLNPGESLSFKIVLNNRENWLDALPFIGTLTTDNEFITINQSQSQWVAIPNGENVISAEIFEISVSDFCPIETIAEMKLSFTADAGTGMSLEQELTFEIPVTGNKDGWPFQSELGLISSSVVFDINQDDEKDIIFIDALNRLYAVNSDKEALSGFPVQIPSTINNPITVSKAGENYNIILAGHSKIYAVSSQGEIVHQFILNANTLSSAVSYDVTDTGYDCIAIGDVAGNLFLFDNELNLIDNYPINIGSSIISQPVFVDFNNDNQIDIVVNSNNKKVNIFTAETGEEHSISPVFTGVNIVSGIVAANNNESTYLLLAGGMGDNNLKVINHNGIVTAEYVLSNAISTFPIIADMDNDDNLEIVCATNNGYLYLFDLELNLRDGFPVDLSGLVTQSPILVDFNNDNVFEVLVPVNNGTLHNIALDGQELSGFPYTFDHIWHSTPVLSDIQSNNSTNILISNAYNLYYLSLPFSYNESPYPMQSYNVNRNAVYSSNFTPTQDDAMLLVNKNHLLGNYPNPFNPSTSIYFSAEKTGIYTINIYNIKGQKVNSLTKAVSSAGEYNIVWNGQDFENKAVSSGIYFYKLANAKNDKIKKMILMK